MQSTSSNSSNNKPACKFEATYNVAETLMCLDLIKKTCVDKETNKEMTVSIDVQSGELKFTARSCGGCVVTCVSVAGTNVEVTDYNPDIITTLNVGSTEVYNCLETASKCKADFVTVLHEFGDNCLFIKSACEDSIEFSVVLRDTEPFEMLDMPEADAIVVVENYTVLAALVGSKVGDQTVQLKLKHGDNLLCLTRETDIRSCSATVVLKTATCLKNNFDSDAGGRYEFAQFRGAVQGLVKFDSTLYIKFFLDDESGHTVMICTEFNGLTQYVLHAPEC